jgi:hypothetical protein
MAVNAFYAMAHLPENSGNRSLSLVLHDLPHSHQQGPDYLNVLKILDIPQALLLAASVCDQVRVDTPQPGAFSWTETAARNLGWEKRLQIRREDSSALAR